MESALDFRDGRGNPPTFNGNWWRAICRNTPRAQQTYNPSTNGRDKPPTHRMARARQAQETYNIPKIGLAIPTTKLKLFTGLATTPTNPLNVATWL